MTDPIKHEQHICWNCSAKVPRLPEDIARGQANTDAVGRGEAMPRPYEVGVRREPGAPAEPIDGLPISPARSPAVERESGSMWFYATEPDSEDWIGPLGSSAEAIEEGRATYAGQHESFWVDEALPIDWPHRLRQFADADDMLERLADSISDNEHVEDPEPEFATSKAEAQAALEYWFAAHVKMRPYYQCVGKPREYLVSNPQPESPDARPEPNDTGVIRAAEGVVLEAGEYEVVEIAAWDTEDYGTCPKCHIRARTEGFATCDNCASPPGARS